MQQLLEFKMSIFSLYLCVHHLKVNNISLDVFKQQIIYDAQQFKSSFIFTYNRAIERNYI